MVNGIMGYSTYYNNNESLLRGVELVNEAKAVAKAQALVKATTNTAENTAANYSGFSKSSHFEGNVVGVANQLNMRNLSEDELGLLKKPDDVKSPQEVFEDAECKTCAERKYQDGSDDPGVSFKTAAHISPDQAAAKVRSHEYEHVVREQAKAKREDREVVSQSVQLHTSICPECGRSYVSGGVTNTVTKGTSEPQQQTEAKQNTGNVE